MILRLDSKQDTVNVKSFMRKPLDPHVQVILSLAASIDLLEYLHMIQGGIQAIFCK